MKPQTLSLLPPFTEAVVTVTVFVLIALFGIPAFEKLYAEMGFAIENGFTRLFFRIGPLNLILVAFTLGIGASLGRLRADCRWVSRLSALLILILGVLIAWGMIAPSLSWPTS
jgi:hypothetical protein